MDITMDFTTVSILLCVIISHWIADFVCQAEVWAINKKHDFSALVAHTITYSIVVTFLMLGALDFDFKRAFWFWFLAFTTHTIVDYFTSKIVGKKFEKKQLGSNIPNLGAFTWIGLDQMIHYICLFLTLYFLYL